ncbi:MAG: hypothetical protein KME64_41390 [Scytonematopsis contorta HA4267-MV1]|jgi:hypothetical protein|nr:hypothetical protein [Scytonematopsis contorta HA4267-MV1]
MDYKLAVTVDEIEQSDGYLEYHDCGYPIYYSYRVLSDNGNGEREYFEPVDIIAGSTTLWESLILCPCCNQTLE